MAAAAARLVQGFGFNVDYGSCVFDTRLRLVPLKGPAGLGALGGIETPASGQASQECDAKGQSPCGGRISPIRFNATIGNVSGGGPYPTCDIANLVVCCCICLHKEVLQRHHHGMKSKSGSGTADPHHDSPRSAQTTMSETLIAWHKASVPGQRRATRQPRARERATTLSRCMPRLPTCPLILPIPCTCSCSSSSRMCGTGELSS